LYTGDKATVPHTPEHAQKPTEEARDGSKDLALLMVLRVESFDAVLL
jgi:hypothetical protein